MRAEQQLRSGLLLAGAVIGLFGAWSLLRLGISNLFWASLWLAGGVVLNDGLVAGVALGAVALSLWLLPSWARAPVAAGFVVLGTVTVMAIPVLGRFGAHADNPRLLDRSYGVGWLVLAGIVAVGVIAASAVARRREVAEVNARADVDVDGGHG